MRIVIQKLMSEKITTSRGPATKITVLGMDGVYYGCFENAITKAWREGDVIDYPIDNSKGYNNIQLPKQPFQGQRYQNTSPTQYRQSSPYQQAPQNPNPPTSNADVLVVLIARLDILENKIDRLLAIAERDFGMENNVPRGPAEMPYADSPPPTEEDRGPY